MLKDEDLEKISGSKLPYFYNKDSGRVFKIIEIKTWTERLRYDSPDDVQIRASNMRVAGVNRYITHLIWFLCYGEWPVKGQQVDHIDRDPKNSRLSNLRLSTPSQNSINRGSYSKFYDKDLPCGVYRRGGSFIAQLSCDKVKLYKHFKTAEEAILQRQRWECQYHKEFSPNHKPLLRRA